MGRACRLRCQPYPERWPTSRVFRADHALTAPLRRYSIYKRETADRWPRFYSRHSSISCLQPNLLNVFSRASDACLRPLSPSVAPGYGDDHGYQYRDHPSLHFGCNWFDRLILPVIRRRNFFRFCYIRVYGPVAQRLEQRTHKTATLTQLVVRNS